MAKAAAAIPEFHPTLEARTRLGTGWEAPALLLLTVALLSFGFVSVYSSSAVLAQSKGVVDYYFLVKQMAAAFVGLVALAIAAQVDYRRLRILSWPILFFALALLVIVILPGTESIAPRLNGGRRWLNLGPAQIQPSEVMKLALIIWTAAMAVKKQEKLASLSRGLFPFLVVWGIVLLLIFMEPNLSAACLILLLAALVAFAGGARIGHFIVLTLVGLPILWGNVSSVAYRMKRIAAFLDPSHDPAGVSYQINQAMIAIGSGGIWGRGFGHGLQKFGYLPEPHNDFILAMIGEEWGFVGVLAVIAGFTAFALIGYRIARQAEDLFGFLLAVGITNLIVVQALLHIAVNTAIVPTTGFTLPFISYGGSSVLICLTAVGVLVSIARRSTAK
ncbi:MAG TPA: putative lipid II flippase FtsW [Longimicrobiales bacterium]|nr:putative lipid II flippase FtsW [Longimicrobiales bacterium]